MLPPVNTITFAFGRNQTAGDANGSTKASADDKETSRLTTEAAKVSPAEQQIITRFKARDQHVRAHEQAHLSAAGTIALSGAHFTFATGPDGNRYAVGGEVSIDVSKVPSDPAATLRKAELIRRAALAPATPSSQDHRVAGDAAAMANQARLELLRQLQQEDPADSRQGQGSSIDITA